MTLAEILAWLTIFAIGFAIYTIIVRAAKAITSLVKKYKKSSLKKVTIEIPQGYDTGWTWNEKTKLWEPPPNIKKKSTNTATPTHENYLQEETKKQQSEEDIDYSKSYQSKYLFTMNEWYNYKKLKEIAEVKNYIVCPKVRLLDIIEPRRGEKHYKTLFYKIQAKHVDFVICDQNMRIKAIIELDDNSHDREDRQERDKFVDLILRSVGYTIIHVRTIENNILDTI